MVLFPAPKATYTESTFPNELLYIPRSKNVQHPAIPCLYLKHPKGASRLLIYFHGNAEDIGLGHELLDHLRLTLTAHVLAVEYPGYGIYNNSSASEARVVEDAEEVFDYLTGQAGWPPQQLLVFGRSIGTGPASWLGAHRNPGALVLMSGYSSIRSVAKHIVGRFLMYCVKDQFRNIDLMQKVTCPTFLVHGQKDDLIPCEESQVLYEACNGPCRLLLPKDMDHNEFDFFDDLSLPLLKFLEGFNFLQAKALYI